METDEFEDEGTEGSSSDTEGILDSLTKALDLAKASGDEKLIDQIGNTITFFTRTHVVGKEGLNEIKRFKKLAGIIK